MLSCGPCDPCDPCTSAPVNTAMYGQGHLQPRLSIVTSFLNDLKRCSSPLLSPQTSPSTHYSATPSPSDTGISQESHDAFASFANLEQFDLTHQSNIPDLQLYSNDPSTYHAPSPSLEQQFDFGPLPKDSFCPTSKPHMAHLDLDFNAFMASLPPSYAM
jgi:hypothetical protein